VVSHGRDPGNRHDHARSRRSSRRLTQSPAASPTPFQVSQLHSRCQLRANACVVTLKCCRVTVGGVRSPCTQGLWSTPRGSSAGVVESGRRPRHQQWRQISRRDAGRDIQIELFYDYRTNVATYPVWQAWSRQQRPPLLVMWGRYDPSSGAAETIRS
jgi:hypothetical protein